MRFGRLVLLAVVVVLTGSCSGDDDEQRAAATSTTAARSSSTTGECPTGDAVVATTRIDDAPVELASVDRGASVDIVGIFVLDGCERTRVTIDGQDTALPVGGAVLHADGLACTPEGIVVRSATSDDGVVYQTTDVTYRLEGSVLVEVDRTAGTAEGADVAPYYELDCG